MKLRYGLILAVSAALMAGCEKKPETVGDVIADKVGDATDTRDHEGVKDAAEDVSAAVEDTASDLKDAVKGE